MESGHAYGCQMNDEVAISNRGDTKHTLRMFINWQTNDIMNQQLGSSDNLCSGNARLVTELTKKYKQIFGANK
jgi:hypothetical protein